MVFIKIRIDNSTQFEKVNYYMFKKVINQCKEIQILSVYCKYYCGKYWIINLFFLINTNIDYKLVEDDSIPPFVVIKYNKPTQRTNRFWVRGSLNGRSY